MPFHRHRENDLVSRHTLKYIGSPKRHPPHPNKKGKLLATDH
jgi:hypothetical protein